MSEGFTSNSTTINGGNATSPCVAANPLPITGNITVTPGGGQVGLNITNNNAAIPGTATTITLNAPSTQITITTYNTPAILYVRFDGGTASAGSNSFPIAANGSLTYSGAALATISIIGASAAGRYAVLAH